VSFRHFRKTARPIFEYRNRSYREIRILVVGLCGKQVFFGGGTKKHTFGAKHWTECHQVAFSSTKGRVERCLKCYSVYHCTGSLSGRDRGYCCCVFLSTRKFSTIFFLPDLKPAQSHFRVGRYSNIGGRKFEKLVSGLLPPQTHFQFLGTYTVSKNKMLREF
jgi:hypothetical protein